MGIKEIQKEAKKEAEIAEKAEILTSLLRGCCIEGIDLDAVTRLERREGTEIYLIDKIREESINITHNTGARSAYNIIKDHIKGIENQK